MSLFRRRREAAQPPDRIEWVISTARRLLAERGIKTMNDAGEVTITIDERLRQALDEAGR